MRGGLGVAFAAAIFCLLTIGGANGVELEDVQLPLVRSCICTGKVVDCSNGQLNRIPINDIPQDTEVLIFSNNLLTKINHDDFTQLPFLKVIDLSHNLIEEVELGAFEPLFNLQNISLAHNFLKGFPIGLFDHNMALEVLNMANNVIEAIPAPFVNINLRILNMTSNRIEDLCFTPQGCTLFDRLFKLEYFLFADNLVPRLPSGVLEELTLLKKVDLSHNKLSQVSVRAFVKQFVMEVLNLSHNDLKELKGGSLACPKLKEVDLSFNELPTLPESFFDINIALEILKLNDNHLIMFPRLKCPGLLFIDLSGNRLQEFLSQQEMPFALTTQIKEIRIARNEIKALRPDIFRHLTCLIVLDLSFNKLERAGTEPVWDDLLSLEELDLSNNLIRVLRDVRLFKCPKLVRLFLQKNVIEEIETGVFQELIGLRVLRLDCNNIDLIEAGLFHPLVNLRILNLSFNPIGSRAMLSEDTFEKMVMLQELLMIDCEICNLPPGIFRVHEHLEVLDMSKNKLTELPDMNSLVSLELLLLGNNHFTNFFSRSSTSLILPRLLVLDISHQQITALKEDIFDMMPFLVTLQMRSNKLTTLPPTIFKCPFLEVLDFSFNSIQGLSTRIFAQTVNLRRLHMHNNKLVTLPSLICPRLEMITVHGNRLRTLPEETFSGLGMLQHIDLKRNRITSVIKGTFSNLPSIRSVLLHENPLNCCCLEHLTQLPVDHDQKCLRVTADCAFPRMDMSNVVAWTRDLFSLSRDEVLEGCPEDITSTCPGFEECVEEPPKVISPKGFGKAFASSQASHDRRAARAVDGRVTSWWEAKHEGGGEWIVIDMLGLVEASAWEMWFQKHTMKEGEIQWSNGDPLDESSWHKWAEFKVANPNDTSKKVTASTKVARWWRVLVTHVFANAKTTLGAISVTGVIKCPEECEPHEPNMFMVDGVISAVSASSSQSGHGEDKATDFDLNSEWKAMTDKEEWVVVDMGEAHDCTGVQVEKDGPSVSKFHFEVGTTSSGPWSVVGFKDTPATETTAYLSFTRTSSRFWRIRINESHNAAVNIAMKEINLLCHRTSTNDDTCSIPPVNSV